MRLAAVLALCATALPLSLSAKLRPDLNGLQAIPRLELPAEAVDQGLQRAALRRQLPLQFAVGVPTVATLAEGQWGEAAPGLVRWRLRLFSPGATSLHAHFSRFRLPESAELWIYDEAGELVQGPFTHQTENADGRLATALVLGSAAVLELRVLATQRDAVELELAEVFHGFRDLRQSGVQAKAGACERDVTCPEGEAWSNEIRSVARLQIGQFLCSGQLVNNTRLDEAPFIMTANHCGADAATASNMVAYFNYQRSSCGSGNGSLEQFISGATFRSSDERSDYALMLLNSRPPVSFNVYYSGWNATGGSVNSGSGIHHPQGDEKAISLFDSPARKADGACSAQDGNGSCIMTIDAWQVGWSSGVTEQGSSGSGLWNENRQLVGVLSGGSSDCNGSSGNGQADFYGRFDAAWNNGGLKAQLDPGNTGALEIEGKCAGGTPGCPGGPQNLVAQAEPARFGGSFGWLLSVLGLVSVALRRSR